MLPAQNQGICATLCAVVCATPAPEQVPTSALPALIDGSATCISPCGANEHCFDEGERADCETIVASAVANELAPSVAVTAAITETMTDPCYNPAPTGLTLASTYDDFEKAVTTPSPAVECWLKHQKAGKRTRNQYVQI